MSVAAGASPHMLPSESGLSPPRAAPVFLQPCLETAGPLRCKVKRRHFVCRVTCGHHRRVRGSRALSPNAIHKLHCLKSWYCVNSVNCSYQHSDGEHNTEGEPRCKNYLL